MFPFMLLGGCLINLLQFADMLNHSFEPNCFFHWRFKDRMLEVMINAGKRIKKGDEVMPILFYHLALINSFQI